LAIRKGKGSDRARRESRRRLTGAKQRRGRKEGRRRGTPLTGGAGTSARQEEKKRDGGRGLPRGKRLAGCWVTGPKGKRGKLFSFFFFKLFSNLSNSNSNQTFLNFSQNFYKYFRIHPSNQKPCKVK
jgi:hypothetical protein